MAKSSCCKRPVYYHIGAYRCSACERIVQSESRGLWIAFGLIAIGLVVISRCNNLGVM